MPRTVVSVTLEDARRFIAAGSERQSLVADDVLVAEVAVAAMSASQAY